MKIIVDRLYINGEVYYNVLVEAETTANCIETTCMGWPGVTKADVMRNYKPGRQRTVMRIDLPKVD